MPGPLLVDGKLGSQAAVAAVTPGRLVHVMDRLSQRRFLCDTGSTYSFIPHQSTSPCSGPTLRSASGQPIQCWGEELLTIQLGDTTFNWTFLKAAVSFPILGIDFFKQFHLLVDGNSGLVDSRSLQLVAAASHQPRPSTTRGAVLAAASSTPPPLR